MNHSLCVAKGIQTMDSYLDKSAKAQIQIQDQMAGKVKQAHANFIKHLIYDKEILKLTENYEN